MIVTGIDAAFAHFGMCVADIEGTTIKPIELLLLSTEGQDKKVVRKSSDDLRRAKELIIPFHRFCSSSVIAFAEVPHGSQSARASWSLGIAVGVLASCPIPMIQVSALEVKMATVGRKNASKDDMIQWATSLYPGLNWIRCRGRITNANEHLADSVATIHAGVKTNEYKSLMALKNLAYTTYNKPTSKERKKLL